MLPTNRFEQIIGYGKDIVTGEELVFTNNFIYRFYDTDCSFINFMKNTFNLNEYDRFIIDRNNWETIKAVANRDERNDCFIRNIEKIIDAGYPIRYCYNF